MPIIIIPISYYLIGILILLGGLGASTIETETALYGLMHTLWLIVAILGIIEGLISMVGDGSDNDKLSLRLFSLTERAFRFFGCILIVFAFESIGLILDNSIYVWLIGIAVFLAYSILSKLLYKKSYNAHFVVHLLVTSIIILIFLVAFCFAHLYGCSAYAKGHQSLFDTQSENKCVCTIDTNGYIAFWQAKSSFGAVRMRKYWWYIPCMNLKAGDTLTYCVDKSITKDEIKYILVQDTENYIGFVRLDCLASANSN